MMKHRIGSRAWLFLCVTLFSSLHLSAQSEPAQTPPSRGNGIITGRITIKGGGPLTGGQVFFYDTTTGPPPFEERFRRLPDINEKIGTDGRFTVELPAGKYYMRAWKKMTEAGTGLQDGDYIFFSLDDKRKPKEYISKNGAIVDLGTIAEAVPYKQTEEIIKTAIEGVITDVDGKPVEGASVFAFVDQTTTKRPLFVSRKTGKDGKYILRIPEGTYYIRARNKLRGGPLQPGQMMGFFGNQQPVAVTVKDGEIKIGVDIKGTTFQGRGFSRGTTTGGPGRQ